MADPAERRKDSPSQIVKDQGWDILVGGKQNAVLYGGEDPFDSGAAGVVTSTQKAAKTAGTTAMAVEFIALGDLINRAKYVYEADEDTTSEGAEAIYGDGTVGAEPALPTATSEVPTLPEVEEWVDENSLSISGSAITTAIDITAEKVNITDPFSNQTPTTSTVSVEEKPVNTTVTSSLLTAEQFKTLSAGIDAAYQRLIDEVRGDFLLTENLLEELRQARMYLHSGEENYDEAEKLLYGVESRLMMEKKVRQWSRSGGTLISLYLIIWLALIVVGMVTSEGVIALAGGSIPAWMGAMYLPTLFGGVGGVVGALWVLIKHTTQIRDFDPIHTAWYITNPLMGLLLGMIAYLVTWGGGNVLTLITSGTANSITLSTVSPAIYPLCLVVGFNQNVLWNLIDKFIEAIFPSDDETSS